jgi:hypothetical protein
VSPEYRIEKPAIETEKIRRESYEIVSKPLFEKPEKKNDDGDKIILRTDKKPTPDKKLFKRAGIFIGVIIGIIAVVLFLWKPWKEGVPNKTTEYQTYSQNFENYLSKDDFKNAWNELEKLKNNRENISLLRNNLISSVNSKVETLKSKNTENDLREAKLLLVQSVEYGNSDIMQDTIDITESIRLIQATNAIKDNLPKYEYAKFLCENILKSQCSDNIKNQAKELSDNAQTKIKEIAEAKKKGKDIHPAPADCEFMYQIVSTEKKRKWRTSDLMKELEKRYEYKSYQVVIDGCDAIIQYCATYKRQAEELKIKAMAKRSFIEQH